MIASFTHQPSVALAEPIKDTAIAKATRCVEYVMTEQRDMGRLGPPCLDEVKQGSLSTTSSYKVVVAEATLHGTKKLLISVGCLRNENQEKVLHRDIIEEATLAVGAKGFKVLGGAYVAVNHGTLMTYLNGDSAQYGGIPESLRPFIQNAIEAHLLRRMNLPRPAEQLLFPSRPAEATHMLSVTSSKHAELADYLNKLRNSKGCPNVDSTFAAEINESTVSVRFPWSDSAEMNFDWPKIPTVGRISALGIFIGGDKKGEVHSMVTIRKTGSMVRCSAVKAEELNKIPIRSAFRKANTLLDQVLALPHKAFVQS